ncbi:MAG TPA: 2Fe-2S iron-sulfur cluster-binding protein [Pseudolabrys sp.]|nr:2Fe-2S iron-sulfur cluster-binding protein [Pseudolabrys sp.]
MTSVQLTVNGSKISADVAPRLHLADFLREHQNLTATHLRCEQGACGACTVLIDGQPARSCITYTVMCDGAAITTLEGLENDAIMVSLRRTFSEEHGLQCGYCTPGMLVTSRDIVLRLPDADQRRIRSELSGNICRCTGYVGIVRAITRVLEEQRKGKIPRVEYGPAPIGPVGARSATAEKLSSPTTMAPPSQSPEDAIETTFGLAGRQPNLEIRQSFRVSRPPPEVWAFFSEIARVVACMPGAHLTRPPADGRIEGEMSIKLGPITTNFTGQARIERDENMRRGIIMGAGRDRYGASRAAGEAEYVLEESPDGGTLIVLSIRALLVGPLAQFGRGAIVEDLVARITQTFAHNIETSLAGAVTDHSPTVAPLRIGSLVRQIIWGRLSGALARFLGRRTD